MRTKSATTSLGAPCNLIGAFGRCRKIEVRKEFSQKEIVGFVDPGNLSML